MRRKRVETSFLRRHDGPHREEHQKATYQAAHPGPRTALVRWIESSTTTRHNRNAKRSLDIIPIVIISYYMMAVGRAIYPFHFIPEKSRPAVRARSGWVRSCAAEGILGTF